MTEYTPTTDEIASALGDWALHNGHPEIGNRRELLADDGETLLARWLAAHDREVAAKALRDAADEFESGTVEHDEIKYSSSAPLGWTDRSVIDAVMSSGPVMDWLRARAAALASEPSTTAQETITCFECTGKGNVGLTTCIRCHGTGRILAKPSTPAPEEPERPTCTDFHWVGQAFSSCDMCGKPFWDHVTHRGEPISDEFRAGVKRKWEVVEPDPESTTDTKGTP